MDSAAVVWPLFNSLQAFWPGLQVCNVLLILRYIISIQLTLHNQELVR